MLHVVLSDHTHLSIACEQVFVLKLLSIGSKNGEKKCGVLPGVNRRYSQPNSKRVVEMAARRTRHIFNSIHYLLTHTARAFGYAAKRTHTKRIQETRQQHGQWQRTRELSVQQVTGTVRRVCACCAKESQSLRGAKRGCRIRYKVNFKCCKSHY